LYCKRYSPEAGLVNVASTKYDPTESVFVHTKETGMEVHLATTDWLVNRTGSDEQRLEFEALTGRMVKPSTSTVLGDGGWDTVTDSKST
jgi:hypothetical protein